MFGTVIIFRIIAQCYGASRTCVISGSKTGNTSRNQQPGKQQLSHSAPS
jgi:hypothetical protein